MNRTSPADAVSSESLTRLLPRMSTVRAWIIGDLILDEYVEGRADRVSPEAPVPVVHVRGSYSRLGGAANVAAGCVALGAKVSLSGVIGQDEAGDRMLEACRVAGTDTRGIVRHPERPTIRKLRVLAGAHQMLRLDWEEAKPFDVSVARAQLEALRAPGADGQENRPDVIILSDYAKGVLTPESVRIFIDYAREHGVPVLVDPKTRDFSRYAGATVLTPNLKEMETAAGQPLAGATKEHIAEVARAVIQKAGVESMVVTLSERGMLVVPPTGETHAISSVAREVFDVTGAGDTAICALALALAAGAKLEVAATVANAAAGVAVGKIGTAVVTASELARAMAPTTRDSKFLNAKEIEEQVAWWRLLGRKIVFTNGCYDLVHAGHLSLLRSAAAEGDVLVVAINSDDSVRRLKGPERPLVPERERAELLAALDCVDSVVIFEEDTPLEVIQRLQPDVIVKGGDYRPDQVVGADVVQAKGGRVVIVPLVPDRSTSRLVSLMRQGNAA